MTDQPTCECGQPAGENEIYNGMFWLAVCDACYRSDDTIVMLALLDLVDTLITNDIDTTLTFERLHDVTDPNTYLAEAVDPLLAARDIELVGQPYFDLLNQCTTAWNEWYAAKEVK